MTPLQIPLTKTMPEQGALPDRAMTQVGRASSGCETRSAPVSAAPTCETQSAVPNTTPSMSFTDETKVEPVVLSVSDVNVSLGSHRVLQDVSFSINRGELVGLLGPNGAGKTTLIRTILGLLRPDSGTIATASARAYAPESPVLVPETSLKRARRAIGYVPQKQEARWEYPITVEEVVISSLKPRFLAGAKHWRAAYEALEAVGMKEFRSRPISALSGGQRQRVLIARALAQKPSLLLLDEPFTGLDEPNQEALAKMAMSLTSSGISILMSTHDLVQAAGMCDRFILLNRSVRAAGPLQNLTAPELWASTYDVSENAALVRAVQSLTEVEAGTLPELKNGSLPEAEPSALLKVEVGS